MPSTNGTMPAPTTATSLRVVNGAPGWLVLAQFTTFVLANSNPSPVVLTNITVDINTSFNGGRSAVLPFELLSSTTSLQGNPTPGLTGFSVVATGSATVPYNTGANWVSPFAGLSVSIPARTSVRFAVRIPVNPDYVGMIDGYDVNRTAVANGVSLLVGSATMPNGTEAVGWTYQYGPNWSGFTSAFYGTVGLLTPATVVAPSPFALCDENWVNTSVEPQGTNLTCDSLEYPGSSNWFDFDTGRKVPPYAGEGDLSKGFVDCCNFWPKNGATQVDTGVDFANFGAVRCSAQDGRTYTADSTAYSTSNVVCLKTSQGRYVKYYHTATCCGGMQIIWDLA